MDYLELILPLILLLLAFILKLAIDRVITGPSLIYAICELPVDATFLALSFLISFIILDEKNTEQGLFCFLCCLAIAVFIVILWRRSIYFFEKIDRKKKTYCIGGIFIGLLLLNIGLAIFCVTYSINLLLSATTLVVENK